MPFCRAAGLLTYLHTYADTQAQTSTTTIFGVRKIIQGGPKQRGHRLIAIILSNLNRLKNFFTGRFRSKFAVKWISLIPLHLAYVATLPCETLTSANQAINYKLQGSVTKLLRCGEDVNNQSKEGLLLSVQVIFFKSVNIWQSYEQERSCLTHFARLAKRNKTVGNMEEEVGK